MPPELSDDHVAAICRVLIDHGVKFVIIGGMAARLHDTGHTTIDVDICPSPDDANLSHLADALRELDARLRVEGDPDGVPFEPHPTMLRDVLMLTLITEEGSLDLCFAPNRSRRSSIGAFRVDEPGLLVGYQDQDDDAFVVLTGDCVSFKGDSLMTRSTELSGAPVSR